MNGSHAPDWIEHRWLRALMEFACGLVTWPMVLRTERLAPLASEPKSAYAPNEAPRYLRHAFTEAVHLLRRGEVLVVFPEGYPTVDPMPTPEKDCEGFLPFQAGFARLAEMTENDKSMRVAIIPTGFSYVQHDCWQITLRFGPALFRHDFNERTQLIQTIEQRVRELSVPARLSIPTTQETFDL